MAIIDDEETINAFIDESKEHLEGIEDDLLAIEEAGADIDSERVNKVFRAVHSIKGGAGFLGLEKVKELSHCSENVMGQIRNEELTPTPEIISTLLEAIDKLSSLIKEYETSNDADISNLQVALDKIYKGEQDAPPPEEKKTDESQPGKEEKVEPQNGPQAGETFEKADRTVIDSVLEMGNHIYILEYDLARDIKAKGRSCAVIIGELQQIGKVLDANIDLNTTVDQLDDLVSQSGGKFMLLFATIMEHGLLAGFLNIAAAQMQQVPPGELDGALSLFSESDELVSSSQEEDSDSPAADTKSTADKKKSGVAKAGSKPESTLRVNVKLLDNLMTLAGELVLTRNQFLLAVNAKNGQGMENISQRLNLVTSELQEAIMHTRMQPIGNVFNKFKRVVRDLSRNLGKKTNLVIKGEEVELDKTIIESIGDPLTHLVRNSVDHGFEMGEERVQNGKPPDGTLRLTAYHEGGQVMIAIEDDGAGINTDKIKEKALSMGVHDAATLDAMSGNELAKLIFLPGMSTAKEVSDLSGRGVGMDVVNTNISKVGGTVDVETTLGKGTLITIKLPLTLAIIPSLIVTSNEERFAIPQVNMVELVRIPAFKVKERIEMIGKALVMRLRGELLPLVKLSDALGVAENFYREPESLSKQPERRELTMDRRQQAPGDEAVEENVEDNQKKGEKRALEDDRRVSPLSAYNILVVSAGDYHYGLIVDKLLDSEEIVVKPLGSHLRDCNCYAGASIQGDGKVALILDIMGISNIMNLKTVSKTVQEHVYLAAEEKKLMENYQSLLLVRNSPKEQMAVPLDLVSRIEKSRTQDIEITGGRRNIQYRGGTLPLFSVDEVVKVGAPDMERSSFYIVVFSLGGKEVGIIMSDIVDIVRGDFEIDDVTHQQPGIMGSTIINEEITLLVDLYGVVAVLMPEWVASIQAETAHTSAAKILVVEDSPFFMHQLVSFLKETGHSTYTATDGVEAIKVLGKEQIDLVLTDIEMPNMDGLELTEEIRSNPAHSKLPVIAVTSVSGEEAERRGKAAGIDEYLIKLDREKILKTLSKYLL